MLSSSSDLDRWSAVVGSIAAVVDLDASARRHGALVRRRGVRSAADLLRLALLYGPGGLSLRATAGFATQAGLADLCDVSLLERLRNAGDWLAEILDQLLAHKRGQIRRGQIRRGQIQRGQIRTPGRLRLALIDGSSVSSPGSRGSDWRLQTRYEPACGGFSDLRVSPVTTAETLAGLAMGPGDVLVQDRGYARAGAFAHAHARACAVITRIGWRSVKLRDEAGGAFDLLAALPAQGSDPVEHAVRVGPAARPEATTPARLILARLPAEAVEQRHRRLRRKASKSGNKTDPRSLTAAGFLMLLTSVPAEAAEAEAIVGLYRLRWQIELAFKRLKSLGGFGALRADDPRLVRSWLLAHLIAAVLVEAALGEDLAVPP